MTLFTLECDMEKWQLSLKCVWFVMYAYMHVWCDSVITVVVLNSTYPSAKTLSH